MDSRQCIECGATVTGLATSCEHCRTSLDMAARERSNLYYPLQEDSSDNRLNEINNVLLQKIDPPLEQDETGSKSMGELIGNLDAGEFFILLTTMAVILLIALLIGIYLGAYISEHESMIYVIAAIPAVLAGAITWNLLFKIKKRLKR